MEWSDGDKTVVKCGPNEMFDRYAGFCAVIVKKLFGSTSAAKKAMTRMDVDRDISFEEALMYVLAASFNDMAMVMLPDVDVLPAGLSSVSGGCEDT